MIKRAVRCTVNVLTILFLFFFLTRFVTLVLNLFSKLKITSQIFLVAMERASYEIYIDALASEMPDHIWFIPLTAHVASCI